MLKYKIMCWHLNMNEGKGIACVSVYAAGEAIVLRRNGATRIITRDMRARTTLLVTMHHCASRLGLCITSRNLSHLVLATHWPQSRQYFCETR